MGTKFSKRDYERFGFDIIQRRGYEVEAWDFTPWWKPDYAKHYIPPDSVEFSGFKSFNTLLETNESLKNLSETDIVIDPWRIYTSCNLVKMPSTKIGFLLLGLLPGAGHQRDIKYYLSKMVFHPIQSISAMKKKVLKKFNSKRSPDFMITGGKAVEKDNRYKIDEQTYIIKTHALDYDRFLEQEMVKNESTFYNTEPYAVFLDEDMIFHHDYIHKGIEPYCSAERYYPEINNFFSKFEEETGLNIKIAAHPRADYEKRGNPFNGRKIIEGDTVSLVKHSQFVFAHASTSINFAVIYNKPIFILDSYEYAERLKNQLNTFVSVLDLDIINISRKRSINFNQVTINKKKYSQYKEQYIKETGTPEKFVWDIFCDYLD